MKTVQMTRKVSFEIPNDFQRGFGGLKELNDSLTRAMNIWATIKGVKLLDHPASFEVDYKTPKKSRAKKVG